MATATSTSRKTGTATPASHTACRWKFKHWKTVLNYSPESCHIEKRQDFKWVCHFFQATPPERLRLLWESLYTRKSRELLLYLCWKLYFELPQLLWCRMDQGTSVVVVVHIWTIVDCRPPQPLPSGPHCLLWGETDSSPAQTLHLLESTDTPESMIQSQTLKQCHYRLTGCGVHLSNFVL